MKKKTGNPANPPRSAEGTGKSGEKPLASPAVDILALLEHAKTLAADSEREYDLRRFLKDSGLFRIHDYETMGDRPIATYDCGSVALNDTAKSLYRAMFLFAPGRVAFQDMYKGTLLTLVSPDYHLVASIEFFKYKLAVYFSASINHIEGRGSSVSSGQPGADNGVRFKGEIAEAWFGFIAQSLDRQWLVYSGNDFSV